ncbi:SgcJ/EcaC family oxidoreductase [Micromonospora sp. NPDC003197]
MKNAHVRRTGLGSLFAAVGLVAAIGLAITGSATPATATTSDTTTADSTVAESAAGHDRDLAALRQLRDQQEDAWARGDGTAYAAIHTLDADVVTFSGDHLRTRNGIATGMQRYFDSYLQGTRLTTVTEQVRFPQPDLAVIVRTGCVLWPGDVTCTEEALSINTNIAVKQHGKWLFTSFQNTRVRPLP